MCGCSRLKQGAKHLSTSQIKIIHTPPLGLYDKVIITSNPLLVILWGDSPDRFYAKPPPVLDGRIYYEFNEKIEITVDYHLSWEEISKIILETLQKRGDYIACNFIYAKTMTEVENLISTFDKEFPPYLDL